MFNDEFLLTAAVEEGEKTMTRRIIPDKVLVEQGIEKATEPYRMEQLAKACPYKVGDIVAVAMNYSKAEKRLEQSRRAEYRAKVAKAHRKDFADQTAGWGEQDVRQGGTDACKDKDPFGQGGKAEGHPR